ncbi:terpene synthase family protein [Curtobacterium sp. L1-20]|uniref:terpene synthase family protein n=1 Tax=Curtobacterium sp. L1-20 TaxID=3138181 RepID=UPI003B528860
MAAPAADSHRRLLQREQLWHRARLSGVAPPLRQYLVARRQDGPFTVGLDLIERQLSYALPDWIYGDRRFQNCWEAAADVAAWTNDIISAERELSHGDVVNLVAVLQAEGRTEPQAFDTAIEMLDRRIGHLRSHAAQLREQRESDDQTVRWADALLLTIRGLYDWSANTARYSPWRASIGYPLRP